MAALRVAIVGAGIVGAALAWHLARGGARVTVLEAGTPGDGATRHSWGWINAGWAIPSRTSGCVPGRGATTIRQPSS
ncbi:MAG: FAD-dependent oxidoreductase [Pseudomonadota bacterium]